MDVDEGIAKLLEVLAFETYTGATESAEEKKVAPKSTKTNEIDHPDLLRILQDRTIYCETYIEGLKGWTSKDPGNQANVERYPRKTANYKATMSPVAVQLMEIDRQLAKWIGLKMYDLEMSNSVPPESPSQNTDNDDKVILTTNDHIK